MSWRLSWGLVAEQDLKSLHWKSAARAAKAVMRLSEGQLDSVILERHAKTDPHKFRLRVAGASIYLWIDSDERIIHVVRVFPNR